MLDKLKRLWRWVDLQIDKKYYGPDNWRAAVAAKDVARLAEQRGRAEVRRLVEVKAQITVFDKPIAKISRDGHCFWIRDIREVELGVFVGTVDNDATSRWMAGARISFLASEVVEAYRSCDQFLRSMAHLDASIEHH